MPGNHRWLDWSCGARRPKILLVIGNAAMTMSAVSATETSEAESKSQAWRGFKPGLWQDFIDVRDFVQLNYTPYEGDSSFLEGPTERTERVWDTLSQMFPKERVNHIVGPDQSTSTVCPAL